MPTPASTTPLHISGSLKPRTVEDLTPLQQRQLAAAGESFDGKKLTAETRLSVARQHEGGSFAGRVELRELADASGRALYAAVLLAVDSGKVFRAGSTTLVGSIVRAGLDLVVEDAALQQRLEPLVKARAVKKVEPVSKRAAGAKTSGKPRR